MGQRSVWTSYYEVTWSAYRIGLNGESEYRPIWLNMFEKDKIKQSSELPVCRVKKSKSSNSVSSI